MNDNLVVLWSDRDPAHDVWYEIVQLGEGEFELRVVCDGYLWLTEEGPDWQALLDRAGEIRSDLHSQGLRRT
jgi:hypothetical protein